MPLAARGSPHRGLLSLGTCLALALPAPASADPSPLPDWGVAEKPKAAAPAPAPAPTPAAEAPAAPPAAPAAAAPPPAAADDDIVLTDSEPAPARSRKARNAAKVARAARSKPRSKAVKAALARAASERAPIQDHANKLVDAGKPDEALQSLLVGAEAYHDPVLYLAAAEATLARGDRKGRAGVADDDRCIEHVRTAQTLLQGASAEAPRVDPEEHPALIAWGDDLIKKAERHKQRMSARRSGHAEIAAGAVLTTAGLASVGVMSRGLYLNAVSERELDKGAGRPDEELAPLHDQQRRAETMIAAGAIAGAVGLALGIALVAIGARDLKATRREKLATRLRIAPTFGGLVIAGRF
ncbi:MAG: hypothetical protein IPO88_27580 [Nannocystis sp.]|uniref:hypothetical protein n=1 Tax=Nannocystis sp. TaxID=1962667 RepID=UPI0024251B9A|nr:hypothetical protein [Nannocystis sp.]MBK9757191.1 hypothetical protein [Nannocystis sp.]